jgi:hypothetical protein
MNPARTCGRTVNSRNQFDGLCASGSDDATVCAPRRARGRWCAGKLESHCADLLRDKASDTTANRTEHSDLDQKFGTARATCDGQSSEIPANTQLYDAPILDLDA